jgi:hypothetical protein
MVANRRCSNHSARTVTFMSSAEHVPSWTLAGYGHVVEAQEVPWARVFLGLPEAKCPKESPVPMLRNGVQDEIG